MSNSDYDNTMNNFDYFRGYIHPLHSTPINNVEEVYDKMMKNYNYNLRPKLPKLITDNEAALIQNLSSDQIQNLYDKNMTLFDYAIPEILDDKEKCNKAITDLQLNLFNLTQQFKWLMSRTSELLLENNEIKKVKKDKLMLKQKLK